MNHVAVLWRERPVLRRAIPALLIVALLLAGIGSHVLRRSAEVYIVIAAVLAIFLARAAYTGFWSGLDRVGVQDARGRWRRQSPLLQRAVPPVVIAALVLLIAWVVGVLIGLPTLRLRGDYLAIVTLGFGEILPQVAVNGDKDGLGFNLTNGPPGINPIDPPGFGHWLSSHVGLPASYLREQGTYVNFLTLMFWTALGLLLFTVFCSIRLRDSRLGRAWIAIREDETAAAAMGIPLMRTKTWAYASGAFFGGIAGAFLKSQQGGAFPNDFLFSFSIFVLCMVILGGMGSIWGVIVGGAALAYLNIEGIGNIGGWINDTFGTNSDLTKYSSGIYGVILVLMMLFRPAGLIPSARAKAEFEEGVADEPLMDVRGAP